MICPLLPTGSVMRGVTCCNQFLISFPISHFLPELIALTPGQAASGERRGAAASPWQQQGCKEQMFSWIPCEQQGRDGRAVILAASMETVKCSERPRKNNS